MEVDCRLTTLCQDILVNHMIYRNLTKRLKVTTNLKATILLLVLMAMSQGHMDMETLPINITLIIHLSYVDSV
jgi:hypothetical protein